MTFDETMDRFFSRYSQTDRVRAEAWPGYSAAATAGDSVKAQALAIEALEGTGSTKLRAKQDRADKQTYRVFDQF